MLVNEVAEPDFIVYGEGIEAGILSLEGSIEEAVSAHDALLFGSDTLLGERERALTLRARDLAIAQGQARAPRSQHPCARRWRERARAGGPDRLRRFAGADAAEGEPLARRSC